MKAKPDSHPTWYIATKSLRMYYNPFPLRLFVYYVYGEKEKCENVLRNSRSHCAMCSWNFIAILYLKRSVFLVEIRTNFAFEMLANFFLSCPYFIYLTWKELMLKANIVIKSGIWYQIRNWDWWETISIGKNLLHSASFNR